MSAREIRTCARPDCTRLVAKHRQLCEQCRREPARAGRMSLAEERAAIAALQKPPAVRVNHTLTIDGRDFDVVWDGTSPHLIREQFAARLVKHR